MRRFLLAGLVVASAVALAFAGPPVARTSKDGLGQYQAAFKRAAGGERVVLVLGSDDSLVTPKDGTVYRYTKYAERPELAGLAAGVYECFLGLDGNAKWARRVPATPAPAIAQPPLFQRPLFNPLGLCVGRT